MFKGLKSHRKQIQITVTDHTLNSQVSSLNSQDVPAAPLDVPAVAPLDAPAAAPPDVPASSSLRYKFLKESSNSWLSTACYNLLSPNSQSFMQVSISTVSGNKRHRRCSMILPAKLKHDYEETVETRTDIISLAMIDRIG